MKRDVSNRIVDERGDANPLLISTVLLSILLVAAIGGFVWSFMQMTDWRTNGQAKVDAAVTTAKDEQQKTDDAKFKEDEKKPNRTYQGPADLGSIKFDYPKTWSAYVDSDEKGKLEVYFNPNVVPKVDPDKTVYALRVDVTTDDYADILGDYKSDIEDGKIKSSTITIGKTNSFAGYDGIRIDGQLSDTINGSVVVFKVRDKTLLVHVDSQDYMKDFNETVLKTLSFEP